MTKLEKALEVELKDLSKNNVKAFVEYVDIARKIDIEEFEGEQIDVDDFYKQSLERLEDNLYKNVKCILAMIGDKVIGRIEYHYYGAFMDGYKMAYISYVYVLPQYRGNRIAKKLFLEAELRMKQDGINQYYLIYSPNSKAIKFYEKFSEVKISDNKILRKDITPIFD